MIREWLLNNPGTVDAILTAISILFLAFIGAITTAIRAWSANRQALDLTVTAIEKSKASEVKHAVRFGEGTTTKNTVVALHNSIERVSGKRPNRSI